MTDWKEYRLGDCLEVLIDYRGKSPRKSAFGIPVISAKVVKDGRIIHPIEQTIDSAYYLEWMRRGYPNAGDVVLTTEGPLGEVAQLDGKTACYALGQRIVVLRGKASFLDNTFLKFLLLSPVGQERLKAFATGTTVEGISQKALRQVSLSIPDINAQKHIANLLGSLDSKIELNRRMNETLEAMAQAIFRDWFVDFGPTRRKMAGVTNSLEIMGGLVMDTERAQALADLFPAALGDDGLPEGWSFKPLDESLVLQRGFDLPKSSRTDGLYPVIAASGPSGTHSEFKVSAPGVCTGRSGVLGNVFYVQQDFWPLNTSLWVKAYPNATPIYAYFLLREIDLLALNAGSAVPTLNRNHVHNRPTVTPPMAVVSAYTEIAKLLMVKSDQVAKECHSLTATRDLLLPKLMSGEIRVKDAEDMAEAAQ